ncbi:hypothetical protein PR202_ga27782 [Eleusine coracana subsp. coracana]|uniref:Uncharacterized protein n=1 Tax=Eleusine coracana subsp. coracana TaxID=191504 RepID=A0AAV5DH55_ELECO|nr:hypothetical protein PR202_ga27782 [Eleusine coracana subsp. coracana]
MVLKAAVSVTSLPSLPLRRRFLHSTPSSRSAARRLARVSAAMATAVQQAVVVGGGRVGRALLAMGSPGADVLVGRGEKVPEDAPGPILVCTRNDDLDAVLENTPKSRWRGTCPHNSSPSSVFLWSSSPCAGGRLDLLVFFQNGMLDPWFESKGLVDANQVLAYFAVSKLGEPPVDGITDTNPEGLTAAFGTWAPAVAARLQNGGLTCKVLEKEAFQKQMLEKLIWISAFMLVGARHPGATVGVVEKDYRCEVASLMAELASAATAERGLTFDEGIEERLCAYSRAVAHFPTAFKWRNGWFYSLTEKALAAGKPDPCPLHTAWLKEIKVI